jgi:hypothetical protein
MSDVSETINLTHDIRVNGVVIPKGTQTVPKEQVADLMRMDKAYSDQKANLMNRNVYEKNLGSLAGGN